jgi:hypothetical protein
MLVGEGGNPEVENKRGALSGAGRSSSTPVYPIAQEKPILDLLPVPLVPVGWLPFLSWLRTPTLLTPCAPARQLPVDCHRQARVAVLRYR